MKTLMLLMTQYDGRAMIPLDAVARDWFNITPDKLLRKISAGDVHLPLIRMEASQKCAKGVHLQDLADYLDARRAAAVKEAQQLAA